MARTINYTQGGHGYLETESVPEVCERVCVCSGVCDGFGWLAKYLWDTPR